MKNSFTITNIAKEAMERYDVVHATEDAFRKKITRHIHEKYGTGAEITEEMRESIFKDEKLMAYFINQGQDGSSGYYSDLATKMNKEHHQKIQDMMESNYDEDETITQEIEQEYFTLKKSFIDKILLKYYLNNATSEFKEDYVVVIQNNFEPSMQNFAKITLFTKYFNTDRFDKDFTHYLGKYEGDNITPEMAISIERITSDDNFNQYLRD